MLQKKNDWEVINNFKKGKFCFLIRANQWAVELQQSEFYLLYRLLMKLNKQLLEITNQLMEEEFITLEIEQLPWYIELEGKKTEWNLRLVFESQEQTRSFEMYWPIPIAQNLFNEIKNVWESMD